MEHSVHRLEVADPHMSSLANSHIRAVCLLIFAFTIGGCAFLLSLEDPHEDPYPPPLPAPSADPSAVIVGIAVKHKSFGSPHSVSGEAYFVKFED